MSREYWRNSNVVPQGTTYGSIFGRAGNNVTIRGNEITEGLSAPANSRNMAEASLRVLRFYRKACRLIPFILRIHNMQARVTPVQAMKNMASLIYQKSHFRHPALVDETVLRGHELLQEAEMHFTQHTYIYQYLCPHWQATGDQGYSYLDKVKNGNKSKFLKDFYKGQTPYSF